MSRKRNCQRKAKIDSVVLAIAKGPAFSYLIPRRMQLCPKNVHKAKPIIRASSVPFCGKLNTPRITANIADSKTPHVPPTSIKRAK